MGPRTIGHSIDQKRSFTTFRRDLDLAKDLILNVGKTNSEIRAIKKDIARREQAFRILERLNDSSPSARQPDNGTPSDTLDANSQSGNTSSGGSNSEPSCPRFEEIRTYMISKRKELAIDRMECKMPENVMHAHILRVGGLLLSHVEWRQFLLCCDWKQQMFR